MVKHANYAYLTDAPAPVTESRILPLDHLDPHPRNYNTHPEVQLVRLVEGLRRFGQVRPIVVQQRGDRFTILAGHGVVEAAKRLNMLVVNAAVVPESWDEMTATGYVVADNMLAQLANPDEALLAALLQEQVNAGESLEALGYNADELDALLTQLADERLAQGKRDPDDPSGGGDDFDTTPDEDGPTRCQRGEIWQLGEHRLLCGDSTHAADVARLMGGETPDMVWSDPPYGINIVATNVSVGGGEAYDIPFGGVKAQKTRGDVGGSASHIRKTGKPYIAGKRLGSVGGAKPFGSAAVRGSDGAANMIDVGKYAPVIGDETTDTAVNSYTLLADAYPKAIHVWWGANYYANALPPSSCWIVWDKQNTGNFADAELAWCSHKSAVRIFQHMWSGLMKASEKGQRRVHPTQKPIALAAWAFEKYGAPGDVILDPFCGSGMSVVAAERTHRRCFAIEMSAAYCDVITHRWEVESGQTAVRISPAETPQTDE